MRQLVATALVGALIGTAGMVQAADKPNPTGTWKWSVEARGQSREMTLKLKLDGDKLTGAMLGRNNQETAISDAKYKDGELAFSIVRERNGQKMTVKYTGKLSENTIKGKMEFQREGQSQSRDWEAKRAGDANPAGNWKLTIEVNGETHEATLKLKLDGDKLTGTVVSSDGKEIAIQDGKCKDGNLSFSIVRERNGEKMTLKASAKLSGDTMKGKTDIEHDGQTDSFPWEAKRAKD